MSNLDILALIAFKKNLSAYELGAVEAMQSSKQDPGLESNPYEPGFLEHDAFDEGWIAVRDGSIDITSPSLKARFEAAKEGLCNDRKH